MVEEMVHFGRDRAEFDRVVETLLLLEHTRSGLHVEVRDGRGGDGGIDVAVWDSSGAILHIFQLKFFPEGFSGLMSKRRQQVKESFDTAWNAYHPPMWTLVIPRNASREESDYVQKLGDGKNVEVRIMGQAELDALLSKYPQVHDRFARRAALAAELRRLQRKGHSQRALAERFGVNRRTVSALLTGPAARASTVGKRVAPVMAPFEQAVLHLLQTGVRSPPEIRRRLIAEYGLPAGTSPSTVRDFVNRRLSSVAPLRPSTGVRSGDTASGAVEWYTPPELFAAFTYDDGAPIHFDVDVAAPGVDGVVTSPHIAVPASRFITKDLDALEPATSWGSRRSAG